MECSLQRMVVSHPNVAQSYPKLALALLFLMEMVAKVYYTVQLYGLYFPIQAQAAGTPSGPSDPCRRTWQCGRA